MAGISNCIHSILCDVISYRSLDPLSGANLHILFDKKDLPTATTWVMLKRQSIVTFLLSKWRYDNTLAYILYSTYRQMGELWTLFECACLQHLTCDRVVEMNGNISRVFFCSTIFSKLTLNGMKFGRINRKNIAGQSYRSIWGNFGHPGATLDSRLLCTSTDLEGLPYR